jgi:signal transduction histidine kinase/sugar phosphate isomerase/epimerase
MAMKIGFQTIVWGPRVRNLEHMLEVIAAAGYVGVEFFQRPELLRSIDRLLRLLEEHHLKLIGLSGGSLTERMKFCGWFHPEYLYVDTWNEEEACKAMDKGFTLGLHPHAYMPVGNLSDALTILREHPKEEYPRLKFLGDTAHLTVTRGDPVDGIRKTKDRLVAVHLKDWSPEYGRSSFRYARGFVELGAGSVDLRGVVKELKRIDFDGWIVVEQDYTLTDPDTNTFVSARWLAKEGLLSEPLQQRTVRSGLQGSKGRRTCAPRREVLFSRQIARARLQGINLWYDAIATAFRKLIPSKLVEVWTSPPRQDIMSLVAINPGCATSLQTFIPNRHELLSGTTMERKAIVHFDLTKPYTVRRFEHPDLISRLNIDRMVSLPIFNPWNLNHVRLIVNIFPRDGETIANDDELFRFSANVAFAIDAALEDVCSASATKVSFQAGRCTGVQGFLDSLVELVRTTINCKSVAVFLVNESRDRLELAATTGTTWTVSEEDRFYRKGEGLTGGVWEGGDTFLTLYAYSEQKCRRKSFEGVESDKGDDCLFVPLSKPTGDVIGVVRCRRKNAPRALGKFEEVFLFSEDDASVLESIAQAAVPHLELLLAQERRAKTLGKLTHELKVPLVAIRGAAEFMIRTPGVDTFFDYDYPGDIYSWSELMGRLIDNANALRYSREGMSVRAEPTLLIRDVIAPAMKQVSLLLDERGFLRFKMRYSDETLRQIPALWLDRNQFQQVVFNLLANAIKYAEDNPSAFQIDIDGGKSKDAYYLRFRDWGPGIEAGMEELIFEEGVRGPGAIQRDVTGQGLGLSIARQIIGRHGGRIAVTNLKQPTEFTIFLPRSLERCAPRKTQGE